MTLQALGLSPNTPDTQSRIKWAVRKNPADVVAGADPTISVTSTAPPTITLTTNTQGSFNIILYCDPDGSGDWQNGKILIVFNIVIVGLTVGTNSVTMDSSVIHSVTTGNVTEFAAGYAGTPPTPCISYIARVELAGGGSDGKLGLDKIILGWFGNILNDGFIAYYPPNCTETMITAPGYTYPYIDSLNGGTGGSSLFRGQNHSTPSQTQPSVGKAFDVSALDLPSESCQITHTFGTTPKTVSSTDGSLSFTDFLSCYSTDFDHSYSILGKVDWNVLWKFVYSNDSWQNNGSAANGPTSVTTTGFPTDPTTAGAVVFGASSADIRQFYYSCT